MRKPHDSSVNGQTVDKTAKVSWWELYLWLKNERAGFQIRSLSKTTKRFTGSVLHWSVLLIPEMKCRIKISAKALLNDASFQRLLWYRSYIQSCNYWYEIPISSSPFKWIYSISSQTRLELFYVFNLDGSGPMTQYDNLKIIAEVTSYDCFCPKAYVRNLFPVCFSPEDAH